MCCILLYPFTQSQKCNPNTSRAFQKEDNIGDQVLISSTLNVRIFVRTSFRQLLIRTLNIHVTRDKVPKQRLCKKIRTFNVYEIDINSAMIGGKNCLRIVDDRFTSQWGADAFSQLFILDVAT